MAPTIFNIEVRWNDKKLKGVAERFKDLSPAFEYIIQEWVEGNVAKFEHSMGAQVVGVVQDVAYGTYWEPLTEDYREAKTEEGYLDWLMVRTGETMNFLTNIGGINKQITENEARFGEPRSNDAADRVYWNWNRRKAIFLGEDDRRMISNKIKQYLDGVGLPMWD